MQHLNKVFDPFLITTDDVVGGAGEFDPLFSCDKLN